MFQLYLRSLLPVVFIAGCSALSLNPSESLKPPEPSGSSLTYTLAPLPYDYSALEPAIDTETMRIHHSKHHRAYVDNLNKALAGLPEATLPLKQLLAHSSSLPPAIRNNGGGHYNHTFFWSIMAPPKATGSPSPALQEALNETFGSLEKFKEEFSAVALSRFGSGWAWLVNTSEGLKIISTPNQDNPLMDVVEVNGEPLLAVDLWEHAYYLKYRNKRTDYLKSWWSVVNWREVSRLFDSSQRAH